MDPHGMKVLDSIAFRQISLLLHICPHGVSNESGAPR